VGCEREFAPLRLTRKSSGRARDGRDGRGDSTVEFDGPRRGEHGDHDPSREARGGEARANSQTLRRPLGAPKTAPFELDGLLGRFPVSEWSMEKSAALRGRFRRCRDTPILTSKVPAWTSASPAPLRALLQVEV
jgi:hypothetical protein